MGHGSIFIVRCSGLSVMGVSMQIRLGKFFRVRFVSGAGGNRPFSCGKQSFAPYEIGNSLY